MDNISFKTILSNYQGMHVEEMKVCKTHLVHATRTYTPNTNKNKLKLETAMKHKS